MLARSTGSALASAPAAVRLPSGLNATRTTIPVTIDGERVTCVLDTGSSVILVSPEVAQAARLTSSAGTFELAPDGRTHVDRQTQIERLGVAGYTLHDVPALVSTTLSGHNALCGYDFFAHFPTLIDRDRQIVTLFPSRGALDRLRCLPIDISPHVPLATVEINGTWVNHIVLDSGMAGGGALWDGVRSQLRQPLVANADYEASPGAVQDGFACGASALVRFAPGSARAVMPICTEAQRPDGYNGIVETNLPTLHTMAVDYPHRRICLDISGGAQVVSSGSAPGIDRGAWSRFNQSRFPPP
jgi:gag-polyprotein putative aspartyl protease